MENWLDKVVCYLHCFFHYLEKTMGEAMKELQEGGQNDDNS